mmetsp:Transcript_4632/g.8119  ORF Transcript_4632/g.8119 Transcript_4632/m.8119 type:complete len:255 (-) Transcript_4632:600-1364(-)
MYPIEAPKLVLPWQLCLLSCLGLEREREVSKPLVNRRQSKVVDWELVAHEHALRLSVDLLLQKESHGPLNDVLDGHLESLQVIFPDNNPVAGRVVILRYSEIYHRSSIRLEDVLEKEEKSLLLAVYHHRACSGRFENFHSQLLLLLLFFLCQLPSRKKFHLPLEKHVLVGNELLSQASLIQPFQDRFKQLLRGYLFTLLRHPASKQRLLPQLDLLRRVSRRRTVVFFKPGVPHAEHLLLVYVWEVHVLVEIAKV